MRCKGSSASTVDIWDNPLSWGCPLPVGVLQPPRLCPLDARSTPHLHLLWPDITKWSMGWGWAKLSSGETLPRRHNHSHGPCLQFFLNDQLSPDPLLVSLGPTLHPLHPVGATFPSTLLIFSKTNALHPPLPPQHVVSLMHTVCHEIFALYLPNICSLKTFAKCVRFSGRKHISTQSVSIWFVYLCACVCVSMF